MPVRDGLLPFDRGRGAGEAGLAEPKELARMTIGGAAARRRRRCLLHRQTLRTTAFVTEPPSGPRSTLFRLGACGGMRLARQAAELGAQ